MPGWLAGWLAGWRYVLGNQSLGPWMSSAPGTDCGRSGVHACEHTGQAGRAVHVPFYVLV